MKSTIKRGLVLAGATLLLAGAPWQAQAISVNYWEVGNDAGAIQAWIDGLGGAVTVVEDFEDEGYNTGFYDSLATNVGTFGLTDYSLAGTGTSSYGYGDPNTTGIKFELRDEPGNGRFNTTALGSNYLDSADVSQIRLIVEDGYTNLFFYITDPGDIEARTRVAGRDGEDVSRASIPYGGSSNDGKLWFVGIDGAGVSIESITWTTLKLDDDGKWVHSTNDGYGLDGFSTVSPVPEPATLMLFGLGMAGLAGIARRRKE